VDGYQKRLKPLETVIRLWANPPDVPAQKALWLASSATDGKTGLTVNVLSPKLLMSGIMRDTVRRMLRKHAPDTTLDIHTIGANK